MNFHYVRRAAGTLTLAALFAAASLNSAHAVTFYSSGIQGYTGPGSTTVSTISGLTGSANTNKGFGDDYTTNSLAPTVTVNNVQFVGGVSRAGGVVFIEFYTAAGVDTGQSFGIQFASAGTFIYNFTTATPITIPSTGYFIFQPVPAGAITGIPGSTFTAGLAGGTDVGSNNTAITAQTNAADVLTVGAFATNAAGAPANPQTLSLQLGFVPEPGAVAMLMGMGVSGAALLRRRKTARK